MIQPTKRPPDIEPFDPLPHASLLPAFIAMAICAVAVLAVWLGWDEINNTLARAAGIAMEEER